MAGGFTGGGGGGQFGGGALKLKACWTFFFPKRNSSCGRRGEDSILDDVDKMSVELFLEDILISSFCSLKSGNENTESWFIFGLSKLCRIEPSL